MWFYLMNVNNFTIYACVDKESWLWSMKLSWDLLNGYQDLLRFICILWVILGTISFEIRLRYNHKMYIRLLSCGIRWMLLKFQLLIHVIFKQYWLEIALCFRTYYFLPFVLLCMFSVWQMPLVTKTRTTDFFLLNLTCCSHLANTALNIKNKLTPR